VIRPALFHAFTLAALCLPAAALAQTAPVPRSPATWFNGSDWACDWHSCDGGGSVRFALTVTPQGRVKSCEIMESSGNSRIDENTCKLLTRRARFTPARDKQGKPVEGRWESRMHWKVPDPALPVETPSN
jgi:periplasmic protein TonB